MCIFAPIYNTHQYCGVYFIPGGQLCLQQQGLSWYLYCPYVLTLYNTGVSLSSGSVTAASNSPRVTTQQSVGGTYTGFPIVTLNAFNDHAVLVLKGLGKGMQLVVIFLNGHHPEETDRQLDSRKERTEMIGFIFAQYCKASVKIFCNKDDDISAEGPASIKT